MGVSPHTVSIHILDDDSLLNIFYLYRPFIFGEDNNTNATVTGGDGGWGSGRWWYKPAHVCQRWRNIILGSSSYLDLSLVCTKGTPVADMLAHSPPLPLTIDYSPEHDEIAAADEERAILALKQHGRVRRVRLGMPVTNLRRLVMVMNEEYPILETLIVIPWIMDDTTILMFPETLLAPHLRHLSLVKFSHPIGSQLLTTVVGLVSLSLFMTHPATYFPPSTLLRWLSFMPQLETLVITFFFAVPSRDVERQLSRVPVMTHVTLSNLHSLAIHGVSAYLEAVVSRITTPRLEELQVSFTNQLTFSVPGLLQFMNTLENLGFDSAKFKFSNTRVDAKVYLREEDEMRPLILSVLCLHLDWQVSSVAQIFNLRSQMFSAVEHLALEHEVHDWSSEEHNDVDRIEWLKLLTSFGKVKTLSVAHGLVQGLSQCLQSEDGELSSELLPELQEITYSGRGNTGDQFTSFIDVRQNAGRPITLIRRSPSPDPSPPDAV